jgi:carboxylesterase
MPVIFSLDLHPPTKAAPAADAGIVLLGKSRKTVILIHGLTGTPNEMRHLAFSIHRAGYNVICPRLANHGEPLPVLKRTTWEELYDSVRTTFLAALEVSDQVYVGGLSMSALLVLLLAEEFGDKLAGGICLAPTLFFDGWAVPWYQRLLPIVAATPLRYYIYYKERPPYGIKNEKIRAMVHRAFSAAQLDNIDNIAKFGYAFFPAALFHQLRRLAKKVIPLLDRVHAPMLLIHPLEDDSASVKNSQLIYDRISSRRKQLVILNDSYHVVTADQEREKVGAAIKEFLASL